MGFRTSEWIGEALAGTLAGAGAGFIGALLFPALGGSLLLGASAGAVTGFVASFLNYPAKWFWERHGRGEREVEKPEMSQQAAASSRQESPSSRVAQDSSSHAREGNSEVPGTKEANRDT
jgi:hypothetical protein